MKKIALLSVLVALVFGSSCSSLSHREKAAIGAVVVIGAAIAIIANNSDKHYHKKHKHDHHHHGRHCKCRRCH